MIDQSYSAAIAVMVGELAAAAGAANHRRAVVLAGARGWCLAAARTVLAAWPRRETLWVGDRTPAGVKRVLVGQARAVLGRETDAVVFDTYAGFDPDAFGAIAGSVRGGGLLLLLTPALDAWPAFADPELARIVVFPYRRSDVTGRFLRRLVAVLRGSEGSIVIAQGRALPDIPEAGAAPSPTPLRATAEEWVTPDQRQAIDALINVVRGHRRRPLVLTSDRGRGKSAAFGIAAARLLCQGLQRILLTAPRLDAVEPVFEHAGRRLVGAAVSRGLLRWGQSRIEFAPPDELGRHPRAADLLLVDEAAGIPTPLLKRLLERYSRVAFATTVHGYEGSGRGFALRFQRILERRAPGCKAFYLETPVRWAPSDPVERLVFRALLLDASPAPASAVAGAKPPECTIDRLDRDRLAGNESMLSELFGLLVLAHYRTRPYDLRHLLDGPNLDVWAMGWRGHLVGTVLAAREGGLDSASAAAVYEGRRRLRGHLIPQSLAAHVGLAEAAALRGVRIMRVAIHPAVQGVGLGTHLIGAVAAQARADGWHWIGSSFGATQELIQFWQRSGCLPVRVGLTREASSGAHSVLVLRPLKTRFGSLFSVARERFCRHLPHLLADPLRELDVELAEQLLRRESSDHCARLEYPLDERDWRDLRTFAFARRGFEDSLAPIWKLTCAALADSDVADRLSPSDKALLVARVVQRREWPVVAAMLNVPGRAQVIEALRQSLRTLVSSHDSGVGVGTQFPNGG
jgi:tRNA(Met) cytidine acetyltransferase